MTVGYSATHGNNMSQSDAGTCSCCRPGFPVGKFLIELQMSGVK